MSKSIPRATIRSRVCTILLLIGLCAPAYAQQGETSAVPVGTTYAERRSIAKSLDLIGRVEAISRVDVRARVTGYLDAVLFKDGDLVKDGAVLYRIERGLFEAAVKQAEGALESSKAALTLAVVQFQRAQELLNREMHDALHGFGLVPKCGMPALLNVSDMASFSASHTANTGFL